MKKKAFTLSELMLVLSVIGVIAALTIPGLVQKLNNAAYLKTYKKAFSELSQAYTYARMNNDGSIKGVCSSSDNGCFGNIFEPYLKYLKSCPKGFPQDCISGHFVTSGWETGKAYILSNGIAIDFYDFDSNCTFDTSVWGIQSYSNETGCGEVGIDVNGLKPPNKPGSDQFVAVFTQNGLKTRSQDDANNLIK